MAKCIWQVCLAALLQHCAARDAGLSAAIFSQASGVKMRSQKFSKCEIRKFRKLNGCKEYMVRNGALCSRHSNNQTRSDCLSTLGVVGCAVQLLSCVQSFTTPQTVAREAPLPMGFPREEYWSELSFPSPRNHLHPGISQFSTSEPPKR